MLERKARAADCVHLDLGGMASEGVEHTGRKVGTLTKQGHGVLVRRRALQVARFAMSWSFLHESSSGCLKPCGVTMTISMTIPQARKPVWMAHLTKSTAHISSSDTFLQLCTLCSHNCPCVQLQRCVLSNVCTSA